MNTTIQSKVADEFRASDVAKFNRADKNKDGVVSPAEASQR